MSSIHVSSTRQKLSHVNKVFWRYVEKTYGKKTPSTGNQSGHHDSGLMHLYHLFRFRDTHSAYTFSQNKNSEVESFRFADPWQASITNSKYCAGSSPCCDTSRARDRYSECFWREPAAKYGNAVDNTSDRLFFGQKNVFLLLSHLKVNPV